MEIITVIMRCSDREKSMIPLMSMTMEFSLTEISGKICVIFVENADDRNY